MWCTNMTGIHKNDVKQKTNHVEWNLDIMYPIIIASPGQNEEYSLL